MRIVVLYIVGFVRKHIRIRLQFVEKRARH
jgi:hypothetical protein